MKLIKNNLLTVSLLLMVCSSLWSQPNHFVNGSVGFGYSSIFSGIEKTITPGGVGMNLGVGYELRYENFLMNTGVEFNYLNSKVLLENYMEKRDVLYPYIADHYLTYYYTFLNYREKYNLGYLYLPILGGYKTERFYVMGGVKLGVSLFGTYKTDALLETTATDPMLTDTLRDMPNHYLDKKNLFKSAPLNLGLNLVPTLEFGLVLDEWIYGKYNYIKNYKRPPYSYRAGVFVDFGMLDINKADRSLNLLTEPQNNPLDVDVNGLMSSTLSKDKIFNSFFAGIKFTVSHDITQSPKKKVNQPAIQQAMPVFNVRVVEEDTQKPVLALVSMSQNPGNKLT